MWGELSKSVKAVLYDRISSPLLGTFAVSWVLWNHRFITVLLSNMEPIEKFKVVDTVLYSTWDSLLWKMAAFPLLTTALFIFLYPYPARFVFEFTRKHQKRLKEIRQRIDDETPLTVEESREIRSAALQAQLRYEKDMQAFSEENQQLRAELQKLLTERKISPKRALTRSTTTSSAPIGADLTEEAVKALVSLSEKEGIGRDDFVNQLAKQLSISTVRARHLIDTLSAGNYVNYSDYRGTLSLVEKGRELLVSRGLA